MGLESSYLLWVVAKTVVVVFNGIAPCQIPVNIREWTDYPDSGGGRTEEDIEGGVCQ